MQNAKCKIKVSAPPIIENHARKGIPQFCILHLAFCI